MINNAWYCHYVRAEHDKSCPYGWRVATDLYFPRYSFSRLEMGGREP